MTINNNIELILSNGYKLFKSEKYNEAIKVFQKAIELDKQYPKTLFLLGVSFALNGNLKNAKNYLIKASLVDPKNYFVHYNLAKVYSDLNFEQKAIEHHIKTIEINSNNYEAWLNYGLSLKKINKKEDALKCFNKALKLNKKINGIYNNIGDIYSEIGNNEDALKNYNKSLEFKNDVPTALTNIGSVFHNLKNFLKAIEYHKKAIKIKPSFAEAYTNLGKSYRGIFDFKNAILHLDKAIKINPALESALIIKAIILTDIGKYKEALVFYQRVLKKNSKNYDAHNNLGILYLSMQNFNKGWKHYNKRFNKKKYMGSNITTDIKTWDGKEKISSLLLSSEQGIGDQILYASMINELQKLCKKIYFICDPKLKKVFKNTFKELNFISKSDLNNKRSNYIFDRHITVGNLGEYFRKNISDFKKVKLPYIFDNKKLTKQLKNKIKKTNKITCGLSWQSTNKTIGINKSIQLSQFSKIININKISFINLQYGNVKKEITNFNHKNKNKIINLNDIDLTEDLEGLSSIIKNCDFVLTTSNTTAHLAGALNIETIVLVPRGKGKLHYWGLKKDRTPWYPSVKIFRQGIDHTWHDTLNEVEKYIVNRFT